MQREISSSDYNVTILYLRINVWLRNEVNGFGNCKRRSFRHNKQGNIHPENAGHTFQNSVIITDTGGGGGVLGNILMAVCRWDSETLNLYQTTFMSFLQPYSRLDAKNPYPIPD